jgi:hypothetical protein
VSAASQTLHGFPKDIQAWYLAERQARGITFDAASLTRHAIEGVASFLLKQLRMRFGPLSEETQQRVRRARPEELEVWVERIVTAQYLDDVLISVPLAPPDQPHWLTAQPLTLNERQKRELLACRAHAKAKLLLQQLDLHFGPISPVTRVLIEAARADEIEEWAERILTAQTLDDVLVPVEVPAWMKLLPQPSTDVEDRPPSERSIEAMVGLREASRTVGRAEFLERQLSLRFGPAAFGSRARIKEARLWEIEEWVARVLTAPTLDEVFVP